MLPDSEVQAVTVDGGIAPTQPPKNGTCKFPCMPLKSNKRPLRDAVVPRLTLAPPSPYALGASAPSSGWRVHQSVLPLLSSAFSPQEVGQGLW
jgi:hypothetical protein